jgi:hypothetical protein
MPTASRRGLDETASDATPQVWAQMRRKSSFELAAIREACATLRAAMAAMGKDQRSGAGVTAAVLAGERAANECGAQDVRTLFSVNAGRTLQPFETLVERAVDPLQVYIAVRQFNYWAEGFSSLAQRPSPVAEKAAALLSTVVATIKHGGTAAAIAEIITTERRPYCIHPVTEDAFATSLGITLEEPPFTSLGATFEAGEVHSLKIGLTDGAEQHAVVSAMIAVREGGSDVLWSAAG